MPKRGLAHSPYQYGDNRWEFYPEGASEPALIYKFAKGFRIIYRGRNIWSDGDLLGATADAMILITTVEEARKQYGQR